MVAKETGDNEVVTCMAALPILAAIIISVTLLRGWAISMLWGWFLAPLGVPPITIIHGVGISIFGSMFHSTVSSKTEYSTWEGVKSTMFTVAWPLIAVLMGWIAVQFM